MKKTLRRLVGFCAVLVLAPIEGCEDDPDTDCSDGSCVCTEVSCACSAATCDVDCATDQCGTVCQGGDCTIDCRSADSCSVTCTAGSVCDIDCADAGACAVQCQAGADCSCRGSQCVLACTPLTALRTCPDGSHRCGEC